MVEKKKYVRPAIESEEAVEQTSLACTATAGMDVGFADWCTNDVSKGGNFEGVGCDIQAYESECVVVLS